MNAFRRLWLRLSDPLLKKCLWQQGYNIDTQTSSSPAWLNKWLYCDCALEIQRYQSTETRYPSYLWQHSFLGCIEKRQCQRAVKYWQHKPLISIQLSVYKVDINQLQACLNSVARQLYPHWQLCIVEDGSGIAAISQALTTFKNLFPNQVKLVLRDDNRGITVTSQEAFALTDGEYVALLDHDDYLAPEALFEVVKLINQHPDTDWVYSDNDKIDSHGYRCCLHAKPGWSPELLMTYNYILHLSVIRRALIVQAGGFRTGFEGSQDHDLYLRISELSNNIRHIPRVLYSWRQSTDSVSLNPENKSYAFDAALRTLNAALKRRKQAGQAIHPRHSWLGSYQIIRQLNTPDIDVIFIEADNNQPDLSAKLEQQENVNIRSQSMLTYNNKSSDTLQKLINNCQSDFILLLSPSVQFTEGTQLFNLAANLAPSGLVVSSAKVVNSNGQVDHCGLAYQHGSIRYPLRGWPKDMDGIGAYGALPRNITLSSPLISLYKTADLQPIMNKLCCYQDISATLISCNFELQKKQLRLCVDGGIAVLNTQQPYELSFADHDRVLLKKHYPHFFNEDDPLYHHQMNG